MSLDPIFKCVPALMRPSRHEVICSTHDPYVQSLIHSLRELYMKSGKGFLLVFSITSPSSLRELLDLHTQLLSVKSTDSHIPLVLVGNKADLADYRTVPAERALAVSKRWGDAPYYETSAKIKLNVDEVFVDLVRQIIRKDMGEVEEQMRRTQSQDGRRGHRDRDMDGHSASERRRRDRKKRKKKKGERGCVIL